MRCRRAVAAARLLFVRAMSFRPAGGLTNERRNRRSNRWRSTRTAYEHHGGTCVRSPARRRGRRVGGHLRADARHGRGARYRPRRPRVVRRDLGDDDRRDDAADRGAACGVVRPARADGAVRGRVPRGLDCVRPRRLRPVQAGDLVRHGLARVERGRPLRRRRRDRRRGPLRADAVQAAQPSSLPQAAGRRRRSPERARARGRLRRLLRRPDARALRDGRDEPGLDGRRGRRDLLGEGPAARVPAHPPGRPGPGRPRTLGRGGARHVPGLTEPGMEMEMQMEVQG